MAQRIYLKKSSVQDKQPSAASFEFGELAINYASGVGKSFLAAKKYDGTIATFHEDAYNDDKFATADSLSTLQSDIADIKSNYALSATVKNNIENIEQIIEEDEYISAQAINDLNTRIGDVEDSIGELSGNYLDVESATSVFNDIYDDINTINSKFDNFALSSTVRTFSSTVYTFSGLVENRIDGIEQVIEDDEYVIAQAFNDVNSRLENIEDAMSGFDGTYLTVESASSIVNTLSSDISAANTLAESAYTYANNINTNLTTNYYSKSQTNSQIGAASARTFWSAFTAAVTSANSYTDSTIGTFNSDLSDLRNAINTVSGTVSGAYWTSAVTQEKINAAKNEAISSASGISKDYIDGVASAISGTANNRFSTIEESIGNTNSAVSALSAGVKSLLVNVYTYKGNVADYASLPESGKVEGYVYNVVAANGNIPAGTNYAWNGSEWDPLGGSIDTSEFATTGDVQTVASDLSDFKTWFNTASGNLATKAYVAEVSASTVAAAVASAKSYTNEVSGNIETRINSLQEDVSTNASNISDLEGRINGFAISATVDTIVSGINQTILDNEVVTAAALTDLDSRIKYLSGDVHTNYVTSGDIQTINSDIADLMAAINAVSGTVSGTYWTSAVTQSKIAAASARTFYAASAASSSYTKTLSGNVVNAIATVNSDLSTLSAGVKSFSSSVVTVIEDNEYVISQALNSLDARVDELEDAIGDVGSGFFTIDSATSVINTLNLEDANLRNAINAVSGTVSGTYWTSAVTQTKLSNASAKTFYAASAAASSYTNTLSANVVNVINTLNETDTNLRNAINYLSGAVSGNYATIAEASEYAGMALGKSMDYTDSKLSGITSGYFLTVASANSIVTTLNEADTNLRNAINAVSGTVSGTYWTSAVTQSKIAAASAKTFYAASAAASSYTNTLSANVVNAINTLNETDANLRNAINAVSGTVSGTYWTSAVTQSKIAAASAKTFYAASAAASSYTNTLSGNVVNALNTLNEADSSLRNAINQVSGTVSGTYWTSAVTQNKIAASSAKTYYAASAAASSYTNYVSGQIATKITTLEEAHSNFVTKNTVQTITAGKAFSSAITATGGVKLTQASTISATSYRAVPYTKDGDNTLVMYTNPDANSGLTYNPKYGLLRTGGYVINGKTGDDLLTADGKTKSANSFASSGALSTLQSDVATLRNSINQVSGTVSGYYATTAEASDYAGAALANAMAYTDSKIGELSLDNYLTVSSANSIVNTINSNISTLSANVESAITDVYDVIEENEEVTSAALNALRTDVDNLSTTISGIDTAYDSLADNFLSIQSANTVITTINSNVGQVSGSLVSLSSNVKTMLTTVYKYKGSKANYASLPTSNNEQGDVWNVEAANGNIPAGTNYAWTGSGWDALGGSVDLTAYVTSAIAKTRFETIESNVSTVSGSLVSLSSSVVSNYATEAKASSYAAAALSNAMDYTDTRIGQTSGNYATTGQITTLESALDDKMATTAANATFVHKTGDTMTGPLTLKGEQYQGNYGLNANNSDIIRVNSIRTADAADGPTEGFMFYRDTTHFDSIWAKTGVLYFSPNITSAATATGHTVYHSGNLTISDYATTASVATHTNQIAQLTTNSGSLQNQITAISSNSGKVIQENVTSANYRPLLFSSNNNAAQASIPTTTTTGQTYFNKEIYAQPSTGELGATQMKVGGHVTLQYNSTTEALDFIFS